MWFLVRCIFWLGLVFHAMDWPNGEPPVATLRQEAAPLVAHAAEGLAVKATGLCLEQPAACASLTDLIASQINADIPAPLHSSKPSRRRAEPAASIARTVAAR